MDRFKFRFWDKDENRYISHSVELGYGDNYVELFSDENNIIIEQSTGLKDKNGKLIYEGDILKDESGVIGSVSVFEYMWAWHAMDWDDKKTTSTYPLCLSHTLEIIGNIHENPELFECEEAIKDAN